MANQEYNKTFLQADSLEDAKNALEEVYQANPDAVIFVEEEGKECTIEHGKQLNFVPSGGQEGQVLTQTKEGVEWQDINIPDISDLASKEYVDSKFIEYPDTNGYDYVDMGEAGIWATCNIGASKPEEAGLYFAWGETVGYPDAKSGKSFSWNNYKFGTEDNLTKYNSIDGLTSLELEDDGAHVNMGGDWRMPSASEFQNLYNACNTTWTTQDGVYGRLLTLKTDSTKQLFFPAAGEAQKSVGSVGLNGLYLSSSLFSVKTTYYLFFSSSSISPDSTSHRCYGKSIRAFIPPNTKSPKFPTRQEIEETYAKKDEIKDCTCSPIPLDKIDGLFQKGTTITIDQSYSDGGTEVHITGQVNEGDIKQIVDNTHVYACKYLGEEEGILICQLNDNVDAFYDGTPFNRNGEDGEIYSRLPLFSIKGEALSDDIFKIRVAYNVKKTGWNVWENNQLVGYTSARPYNGVYMSIEGNQDTSQKKSHDEGVSIMRERGPQFSFLSYQQRCILSFLYYGIYGTTKDVLSSSAHKFLGILSFCSNWSEKIRNVVINNRTATITMPDGTQRTLNIAGSGGVSSAYIKKLHIGEHLDILPKEFGASYTTGYCGNCWTSNANNCEMNMKPNASYDVSGGDNATVAGMSIEGTNKAYIRPTYQGKITETKDVEYFKSVPVINN